MSQSEISTVTILAGEISAMSVGFEQKRKLNIELEAHRRRINGLRREILTRQEELRAHAQILRLATSPKLLEILGALRDNPRLLRNVMKDPRRFARRARIRLPSGARIVIHRKQYLKIEVYVTNTRYSYCATWDENEGFLVQSVPTVGV